MTDLTETQRRSLVDLDAFQATHGRAPTFAEAARIWRVARKVAFMRCHWLAKKGFADGTTLTASGRAVVTSFYGCATD